MKKSKKNKNYSEEHIKQMTDPRHNQWGVQGEPKKNTINNTAFNSLEMNIITKRRNNGHLG